MTDEQLIAVATSLAAKFRTSEQCVAGDVAAALVTTAGHVYTGICIDTECSLGFCAEDAAVAEMLKARESAVATIVAVTDKKQIIAPCGRCRELLWQVDPSNRTSRVITSVGVAIPLSDLLPYPDA